MKWSAKDCELLAAELLQEGATRWQHVRRTAEVAAQVSARVHGSECVVSAAWLHDIGYAPALQRTGMHAIDGAEFLDREGAPHDLVSLVAFHTGAEFEAEERGLTGKLAQFDRPPQELLDALILADLTSGPTGEMMSVEERLDEIEVRYEPQHPVHRAILNSRPYLEDCAARARRQLIHPI